jgi:pyruvate/2-oxoglutarate dehydrogenase complex dihydrolipoamide dehydrogenase (E3) component
MGHIAQLPNAIAIIGGGVIAVEYATVMARLGVGVSLLCQESDFMPFLPA